MQIQNPRTILYARYSTDLQNPNSVRDQLAKCRGYAERQGWRVVAERSDGAVSGGYDDRRGFQQLRDDIRQGNCEIVLAESLDRLSRDQEHMAALYKEAKHYEVRLHTVERGKVDAMQIGFSSTFSAVFLEDLREKTRRGLEGRIKDGRSAGGLSYGYRVARGEDGQPIVGQLKIDGDEAEIVRRIFQQYAAGVSPLTIAAGLNADMVPAPRGRGAGTGHWKQNTINGNRERGTGVLNNELYIGRRVWNRLRYSKHPTENRRVSRPNNPEDWMITEVPQLRIIDQDVWNAVKSRQGHLTKVRGKRETADRNGLSSSQTLRRRKYLLSGLLECGLCSGRLTVAGTGKRKRYYCANAKEKGSAVCKGMPGLLQSLAEETILAGLRNGLMQESAYLQFRSELERHLRDSQNSAEDELRRQDRQIRECEKVLANLMNAVESGRFSQPVIDRLNEVDAELAALRQKRQETTPLPIELPDNLPALYREHIDELVATLSDEGVVGRASDELHKLLERVIVRHDADLSAHELEIEGDLVEMLAKAMPASEAGYVASGRSLKLVAGAGSNLHLRPEQVKMVAGTGVDHNLRSTPEKMVAGACTHLHLLFRTAA